MKKIVFLIMGLVLFSCDPTDITDGSENNPGSETEKRKPIVTTLYVTTITSTSALCWGEASSAQDDKTTMIGFCWNTSENPTTSNSKTAWNGYNNRFSEYLTGLKPNTVYYVRAYATNSAGTGYGENKSFKTLDVSTPSVSTGDITDITATTATVSGDVTADGGASITERGICWSTSEDPTISDFKTTSGTGKGSFTGHLTDLTPYTGYYVRAYATNSKGTAYGYTRHFYTKKETFTDQRDGYVYKLVTIGDQVWMDENLKYLPEVIGPDVGANNKAYYYVYDYYGSNVSAAKATANYQTYGVLYNWTAAMAGASSSSANPSGVQGACPTGWHLPSDAEWKQLEKYLGMTDAEANATYYRGTNEGGKLKETGTEHWYSPNEGATGSSGFIALPGGCRHSGKEFSVIRRDGNWWSSTAPNKFNAWNRTLYYHLSGVDRIVSDKEYGLSVRCLRNSD
mgnify:CR=1 FL=1